jgi:hypothetical protein
MDKSISKSDISERIRSSASEYNLDPDTVLKIAEAESRLRPEAKAKTSSARGLFQVINDTWREQGGGKRGDINEDIRVGTKVIASNRDAFKRMFDRDPSAAELYTYHVFGASGGADVLSAPRDEPIQNVISGKAYKANPYWQGKTVGDVLNQFERKVGGRAEQVEVEAAPAPAPRSRFKGSAPVFEPLTQNEMFDLGPGYQAAFASMALADINDGEESAYERAQEYADSIAEPDLEREKSPLSKLQLSYGTPFPEEQTADQAPLMLAKGGEARKMMDAVYRADGSPEYGEISMGDFSGDTKKQLKDAVTKRGRATTKEDLRLLAQIPAQGASNIESFTRGSVAALPGMVGDIEAAFRTDPKNQIFPTTEKILKSVPRLTKANKRSEGFEEIGTYDIGLPGAAAARVVSKIPGAVKAAAPVVGAALADATVPKLLKPAIQPGLLEPINIVTPSGRVFLSNMKMGEEPLSRLDAALNDVQKYAAIDPEKKDGVMKFMDTKFRDYVKNRAGTVNDDMREALLTGRIKIPKDTPLEENYPQALIDAAKKGDITALRQIEFKLHGEMGIEPKLIAKTDNAYDEQTLAREENVRAILGQMKENPNVIPDAMLLRLIGKDITTMPTKEAAEKVAEMKEKLQKNPTLFNTVFEDKLLRIIKTNELDVVEPNMVRDYPNNYPALTNAPSKQEGIMALSKNVPIADVDSYPTLFGMDLTTIANAAQHIPEKDLERMSAPEVINFALKYMQDSDQIRSFAKKAENLASAGKEVPVEISTFGTKVIMPADAQGFMWREITNPDAVNIQAAIMKNSIGSYASPGTYGALQKGRPALEKGEVRIFGLYDPKSQLVANAEYVTDKAKEKVGVLQQIKGNGPRTGGLDDTVKYPTQVETLINYLNPTEIPMGIKQMLDDNGIYFTK